MAGDDDFATAYRELFDRAQRVAHRLLGSSHAAEEVAAEAMVRLWLHWPTIAVGNPTGWVTTVATNAALDVLRSNQRVEEPGGDHPDAQSHMDDGLRDALVAALAVLPER